MNIILIGPQASGKGTQAERLAARTGMKHFSTGEAFRAEVMSGSELGKRLKRCMDSGELVPDNVVNEVTRKAVEQNRERGLIFDGYPRTKEQAEFLDRITRVDAVVAIEVSDEVAVQRISSRYVCSKCGKGYNTVTLPPKQAGKCDEDGASLVQRDDDKPEAVRKRLADYHAKTAPLISFFEGKGARIIRIDGEQPIEEVFEDVTAALRV
ncbi:nucleoside monophosphate kinase [Candidatus Woesearchaeota archaeon]|nr:nucleoside monophosphate kinase [Candidatus Woesearchaeota archaeon]